MRDKHARYGEKIADGQRKRMIGNKYRKGKSPWCKGKKIGKSWNSGKTGLQVAWNKGLTKETSPSVMRISKARNGTPILKIRGENHWNWKGGITEENRKIRYSIEYKKWRKSVMERDRYSCVKCGYRSHKRRDIRVDHIKPFSLYPELRFDVSNGRVLCIECDKKHGWNRWDRRVNDE